MDKTSKARARLHSKGKATPAPAEPKLPLRPKLNQILTKPSTTKPSRNSAIGTAAATEISNEQRRENLAALEREAAYLKIALKNAKVRAERAALAKSKIAEIRRKFDQLRIHNYLDHCLLKEMLNVRFSRFSAEDEFRSKGIPPKSPEHKKSSDFDAYVVCEGGEGRSLDYSIQTTKPTEDVDFRIAIDVRNCKPEEIHVDTNEQRVTVSATTETGRIKTLGIICPSTEIADRMMIKYPTNDVLIIEGQK